MEPGTLFLINGLDGLISIAAGTYFYLMGKGTVPKNPRDPEKMEQWRKKYGTLMKVCGPILVIGGILRILGVLG